jgi:aryl-alcohol dehydrogenase-like predicted oxidoreductase
LPYTGVPQGLRAQTIREECERSLRRLGVEQIDLYFTHRDDRETPTEEFMMALDALVREGKVKYIGASNITAWRLVEANWVARSRGLAEYCCVQQRFTYLRMRPNVHMEQQVAVGEEMLDCLRSHGMPLMCYGPLLKGTIENRDKPLDPRYTWPDTDARLAALREVADELSVHPNKVVLAWLTRISPRCIPLFSASKPEQVRENLSAMNVKLTNEHVARLNEAGL